MHVVEEPQEIARSYDRLANQLTWLMMDSGSDDATVARGIQATLHRQPLPDAFRRDGHKNGIRRLTLLLCERGAHLSTTFAVSGPVQIADICAGKGTVIELISVVRALEKASGAVESLQARWQTFLGDEAARVGDLFSLDEPALSRRVEAFCGRLESAEGRAFLHEIVDDVAQKVSAAVHDSRPLDNAKELIARARRQVPAAALDGARTRFSEDSLASSLADTEAALELEPENHEALLLRANLTVLRRGEAQGALADIHRVLSADPGNGEAHCILGSIATTLEGNFAKAEQAFTRAIEAERPHVSSYLYRGVVRVEMGNVDGAEEDAQAVAREQPGTPGCWWLFGRVRHLRGDGQGALDAYDKALAIDPMHAGTYLSRADLYRALGQTHEALKDANRAVEFALNATAYYNRGNLLMEMGDLHNAAADFSSALALDPNDYQALLNRGVIHLHHQDAQAALRDFEQAAQVAPGYAPARTRLGLLLNELGDRQRARDELAAALDCAPDDWAPRQEVADILNSLRGGVPVSIEVVTHVSGQGGSDA